MDTIDLRTQHTSSSDEIQYKPRKQLYPVFLVLIFLPLLLLGVLCYVFFVPSSRVLQNTLLQIAPGMSVTEIGIALERSGVITSSFAFDVCVRIRDVGGKLQQGEYLFDNPESLWAVCKRISRGDFGIERVKILLREGLTRTEFADLLAKELPLFDKEHFVEITKQDEGYLFPDTYFFYKTVKEEDVVLVLKSNFDEKTNDLKQKALSSGLEWNDVVVKASLVELEGKTQIDRGMIADIINRRLEKNIPLQLDAPFLYFMNKASLALTKEDLYVASPYNTYRNKGLPPTPIANPGVQSINTVLNPIANEYLYYLSDKEGVIHYAKTFDEHKKNKIRYLK